MHKYQYSEIRNVTYQNDFSSNWLLVNYWGTNTAHIK